MQPDPTLVQRLAQFLAHALPISPALAVVLSFLTVGAALLALVGGVVLVVGSPKE